MEKAIAVAIINIGNHPDDLIRVHIRGKDIDLKRGESIHAASGESVAYTELHHGGGDLSENRRCRTHQAMAGMTEGPGAGIVRGDFNPSDIEEVARLKSLAAALINEIDALDSPDGRLKALAKTVVEEGAMWAVKAATAKGAGT